MLNGDIICDINLRKMYSLHQSKNARATLAVVSPKLAQVKSFVEYGRGGEIESIAGLPKIKRESVTKKGVFTGVHLVDLELFNSYPRDSFGCVVRKIYQPALMRREKILAYDHPGSWWDLGNLGELKSLDQRLWEKQLPSNILDMWGELYDLTKRLFIQQPLRKFSSLRRGK